MRREFKILAWTFGALAIVAIIGWKILLHPFLESVETTCHPVETWTIDNYKIVEEQCIGFAGPPWHSLYLYKDDIEIDYVNSKSDSCIVKFRNQDGDTLRFDLCMKKMMRKNMRKPITSIEEARSIVLENFKEPIETLYISDSLNDSNGINMAIILDEVLKIGYMADGFEQKGGYRICKYKKE
jgi:hypothetical protein